MNGFDPGKGNDFCISNGKAPEDEWSKIIDRVEAAILMSLANKILADATGRQNEIDEHRKQLKLVDLRNFSRKDSVG
jgi:hypothetical protein